MLASVCVPACIHVCVCVSVSVPTFEDGDVDLRHHLVLRVVLWDMSVCILRWGLLSRVTTPTTLPPPHLQIGRASCRERV